MVTTRRGKRWAALVTGGAGFLGRHVCKQLVDSGEYDVWVFDVRKCDVPDCTFVQGDLGVAADVSRAVEGMDIVFHVATAAPTAQNAAVARELMRRVNVEGTSNVISACKEHGVRKLIYTSSASVVFEGKPLVDIDERQPYARKPMDFYTGTKMEAEKLVLSANGPDLATCALRPSGIFGDGNDTLLVPSVAERCRSGKMKYIIGDGDNVFDWTYVGNVAHAHLCAARALGAGGSAGGEAFFVTNDEPSGFWQMMGDLSEGLGYPRPSVHLPVWLMMAFAALASLLARAFHFKTDLNPMRVRIASVQRTMSCEKAKTLLGYQPLTSMADGKARTIQHFQYLHRDASSKAE